MPFFLPLTSTPLLAHKQPQLFNKMLGSLGTSINSNQEEPLEEHVYNKCERLARFSFPKEDLAPAGVGKDFENGTSFYNVYMLQDAKDRCEERLDSYQCKVSGIQEALGTEAIDVED